MKRQKTYVLEHNQFIKKFIFFYKLLAVLLLLITGILPLAPVFANEMFEESPAGSEESVLSDIDPVMVNPEIVPVQEEIDTQSLDETIDIESLPEVPVLPTSEVPGTAELFESATTSHVVVVENTTLDTLATSSELNTSDTEESLEEFHSDLPTETQSTSTVIVSEVVLEISSTTVSTSPIPEAADVLAVTPSSTAISAVTNDENRFSFAKNECALVGSRTFYCTESTARPEILHTDRVFSAVDAEGDKEIFIEKDSEIIAITNNDQDDDAPFFDQVSNSIVWNRLINGRYQIIRYDIQEEIETQITHDRYNNMQPTHFGNALVWQGWVGDDWEIFLLLNDELTMLTDNTLQDVAPSVNGTHVVWQSFEGNAWRMKVFDIRTKTINTIEDGQGGSVENPRFVLVYDTKFQSGDTETKGYDLKSGEIVSLASVPASVPEEIPDPEQTGEERALVVPPTQPKTKVEGDTDDDALGDLPPPADQGDIIILSLTDTVVHATTTDITSELTEHTDLIVPAIATSSSSNVDHIDDLVVPPFTDEMIAHDSQAPIVPAL